MENKVHTILIKCIQIDGKYLWSYTCQQTVGCLLANMYCVKGDGSNSYLSKGKFSMTIGSELVQVNLTFGCAERAGKTDAVNSGQNDSGIGQKPSKRN